MSDTFIKTMKILSIELVGYKRIKLTNILRIKMSFTETIQLILGSNGSGKSSIMKELTPLPAVPNEYTKDGYKIIEIQKGHDHYVLKSEFSGKAKHSFILNGENLNAGDGTAQIQKELVKRHFGITPEIHSLMVGETRFHSMSTSDRRYWFTQLADTSYVFALSAYKKLKDNHRDIQGAIKLAQTRLAQESNKLLTPEQEQTYRQEVQDMTKFLHELLTLKPSTYKDNQMLQRELSNNTQELQQHIAFVKKARRYLLTALGQDVSMTPEDLQYHVNRHSGIIQSLEHQIGSLSETLMQEQELAQQITDNNVSSSSDVDRKIYEYLKEIEKKSKFDVVSDWSGFDATTAYTAVSTIEDTLREISHHLKPNPEKTINRDRHQYLTTQVTELKLRSAQLDKQHLELLMKKRELEQLKSQHEVECPSCQHRWFRGYDHDVYVAICQNADTVHKQLEAVTTQLNLFSEELANVTEYLTLYRQLSTLRTQWTVLQPFWDYLNEHNILFESPHSVISLLDRLKLDLKQQIQIDAIQDQINELKRLKESLTKSNETNFNTLKERVAKLENKLFDLNQQLTQSKSQLQKFTACRDTVQKLQQAITAMELIGDKNVVLQKDMTEALRADCLNQVIRTVQNELSRKEQAISQMDIQKALVDDLTAQVKSYEEQAHVLKIMVKEMSPTEGLIAKGMLGFINNFVNQINSFIRKIWLYPLELVPVLPDEENNVELDYKFALKAGNSDLIPDIAKGSTAMKEVIDLAFRIVAMQNLKLEESPLLLDEFAASFDAAHRQAAYHTINNVISQGHFTQLFIISHYEQTYGSLKNAEIAVICPSNVVIPRDAVFNRHVSMN